MKLSPDIIDDTWQNQLHNMHLFDDGNYFQKEKEMLKDRAVQLQRELDTALQRIKRMASQHRDRMAQLYRPINITPSVHG